MKLNGFSIVDKTLKLIREKKFQGRGRSTGSSTGKLAKKIAVVTGKNLLKRI